MRINKYIAETGYCSRREVDQLIAKRRVTINGKVAELGSVVEEDDDVHINGKLIGDKKPLLVYLALNKPSGVISTTEQGVPGNIVDFIGHKERIFPIGRLDKESEGLILLTNDGDIVNRILRQEGKHEKEYIVTVNKSITQQFIRSMASGVRILGTKTLPAKVSQEGERVFRIILTQGMNRQVRRMCENLGYEVRKLQRVRVMNIRLAGMKSGEYRNLTEEELQELFAALDYQPEREIAKPKSKPQPPITPQSTNLRRSQKRLRPFNGKGKSQQDWKSGKPRPEGGFKGGRPTEEAGTRGGKPRHQDGGFRDGQPIEEFARNGNNSRQEGGYRGGGKPREGGFKPRSEGGYQGGGNSRDGGKPREGGFKPRSEGGYQGGGNSRDGGKPREGGFKPRSEGGYQGGGNSRDGGKPREGGFKPRSEGGYQGGGNSRDGGKPRGGAGQGKPAARPTGKPGKRR
ncbi:23S rRNA pseudouridine(2604) synthase RluF [Tumebacillus permanentifrigoris]|nr:23S rRNA pseudouridine(2604) synthase RluF [Tumebacillus permanentifrigoris]